MEESRALTPMARDKPTQIFHFESFGQAWEIAKMVADSELAPKAYRRKPQDIIVAWQLGAEVGLSPMRSLAGIAVINGKASLYGDEFLAVGMSHPHFGGIEEMDFEQIERARGATCIVTRKGWPAPVKRTFSIANAEKSHLWGKPGPWTDYPWRMLQMRARGFAMRDAFADSLAGLITVEEAQDYPPEERKTSVSVIDVPDGTHDFGFKSRHEDEKEEKKVNFAQEEANLRQLIASIDAAQTEDELNKCTVNGDLDPEGRAYAATRWKARREEIRKAKSEASEKHTERDKEDEPPKEPASKQPTEEPVQTDFASKPDPWVKRMAEDREKAEQQAAHETESKKEKNGSKKNK